MTPLQFARQECANMNPDGTCWVLLERLHPENWDFHLPLPDWMTEERWSELVEAARANERKEIIYYRRGPYLHGQRRYDFYFCNRCGVRMGCVDELCPDCRPRVKDYGSSAVCLLARSVPMPCSYFEDCILPLAEQGPVKNRHGLEASRQKAKQAYLKLHDLPGAYEEGNLCSDCGRTIPKRRRYCERCADRRRRATYHRRRKKPEPRATVNSKNSVVSACK